MKASIILIIGTFSLYLSSFATATDFGVAKWGDKRDAIASTEERSNYTPENQMDYLIYGLEVLGIPNARLVYQFRDQSLSQGSFIFKETYSEASAYIRNFDDLTTLISKKYGIPSRNGPIWLENVDPSQNPDPGNGLMADKLYFQAVWNTDRTVIEHQLSNNDGKIFHQITYRPSDTVLADIFETDGGVF